MHIPRKSLYFVTIAGALLGTPALAAVHAPAAPVAAGHPPLRLLATLPPRVRVRRRDRGAKRRAIAWWDGLRVKNTAATNRARDETLQPRLASHDAEARGPPRSSRT